MLEKLGVEGHKCLIHILINYHQAPLLANITKADPRPLVTALLSTINGSLNALRYAGHVEALAEANESNKY